MEQFYLEPLNWSVDQIELLEPTDCAATMLPLYFELNRTNTFAIAMRVTKKCRSGKLCYLTMASERGKIFLIDLRNKNKLAHPNYSTPP